MSFLGPAVNKDGKRANDTGGASSAAPPAAAACRGCMLSDQQQLAVVKCALQGASQARIALGIVTRNVKLQMGCATTQEMRISIASY